MWYLQKQPHMEWTKVSLLVSTDSQSVNSKVNHSEVYESSKCRYLMHKTSHHEIYRVAMYVTITLWKTYYKGHSLNTCTSKNLYLLYLVSILRNCSQHTSKHTTHKHDQTHNLYVRTQKCTRRTSHSPTHTHSHHIVPRHKPHPHTLPKQATQTDKERDLHEGMPELSLYWLH